VPADGNYDIYASATLASHPWFRRPLNLEHPIWKGVTPLSNIDRGARIDWLVDGMPVRPSQTLTLRRGQRLEATSREPLPVGIMLPGSRNEFVFCRPQFGITLEASENPRWHVPNLGALIQLARGSDAFPPRAPCRR
jgi:hypothetical protein